MTFSAATTKGNMNTSVWISATGRIEPDTPAHFKAFLENNDNRSGQIVLHSPGGNLAAGLELGRMIRGEEMTTHIGRTERTFESYDQPCDTWYDDVVSGICASSCAYAFLGGKERFVDSPYYPTERSLLGFHQFYGNPERGSELLSPDEVARIETSTLSVAQALTGQIVLYAVEMGVDPRVVAFAASTPSNDLYYPTEAELAELAIASGSGLGAWFMEPYGSGLVTAARPRRSDSMLRQITAFCLSGAREAQFLLTMDLSSPSYPDPDDLPLNGIELKLDGQMFLIRRPELTVKYGDGTILITMPVETLKRRIDQAREIDFRLDGARSIGGFRESNVLDDAARKSLALA